MTLQLPGTPPLPARKPNRTKFLAAGLVSVERALIHRAISLSSDFEVRNEFVSAVGQILRVHGVKDVQAAPLGHAVADILASQFEQLAEELHWQ